MYKTNLNNFNSMEFMKYSKTCLQIVSQLPDAIQAINN